jgi:IS5 family transposase
MKQMSLSSNGFELKTGRTRKREFLDEMELVVCPGQSWWPSIEPYASKVSAKGGRPPFAVATMLRTASCGNGSPSSMPRCVTVA